MTQSLLPTESWSKSLLLGLLREGILSETYNNQVTFGYQRLGDVLRALVLVRQPPEDLRAWHDGLGNRTWAERGTLGALAIVAPEVHDAEIIDLLKDKKGRVDYEVLDAFVESIVLRAPQHTTDRTVEIVARLLTVNTEEWPRRVRAKLVRVACVPDHRLNADLTHDLLTSMELHERDLSWSEWLVDSTEYDPRTTAKKTPRREQWKSCSGGRRLVRRAARTRMQFLTK